MRILITHNNFPAQFRHICEHLGRREGVQVVFATKTPRPEWNIPGVNKVIFSVPKRDDKHPHPLVDPVEDTVNHGVSMLKLGLELKKRGFIPDIILGHSGWGQTLYLRDVFPDTPFIGYFEWYYTAFSPETLFDGQPRSETQMAQLRTRNTSILHDLISCSAGVTPTAWQRDQFPEEFRSKLVQAHDGIDTNYFAPHPGGRLPVSALDLPGTDLTGARELVTYCSRGMEPYRGFPQFYEALPAILDARPDCHVLIVGEDRICYSPRLPDNGSYVDKMRKKVTVDDSRVHFTGALPYGKYKQVLLASDAHVYLSWPFVLSWSMLEAMSCGCLVIGSDTQPVTEVIKHGQNGLLTPFHSPATIAADVVDALARADELEEVRTNARQTILNKYCLSKCLPLHLDLIFQTAKDNPGHRTTVNQRSDRT